MPAECRGLKKHIDGAMQLKGLAASPGSGAGGWTAIDLAHCAQWMSPAAGGNTPPPAQAAPLPAQVNASGMAGGITWYGEHREADPACDARLDGAFLRVRPNVGNLPLPAVPQGTDHLISAAFPEHVFFADWLHCRELQERPWTTVQADTLRWCDQAAPPQSGIDLHTLAAGLPLPAVPFIRTLAAPQKQSIPPAPPQPGIWMSAELLDPLSPPWTQLSGFNQDDGSLDRWQLATGSDPLDGGHTLTLEPLIWLDDARVRLTFSYPNSSSPPWTRC